MIASIAHTHELTLVSGNVEEFSRVIGLKVEKWVAPPSGRHLIDRGR